MSHADYLRAVVPLACLGLAACAALYTAPSEAPRSMLAQSRAAAVAPPLAAPLCQAAQRPAPAAGLADGARGAPDVERGMLMWRYCAAGAPGMRHACLHELVPACG